MRISMSTRKATYHPVFPSRFLLKGSLINSFKCDACGCAETEEYKASPSPKRQGTPQAAINITASSAASRSPVARALFKFETQGALALAYSGIWIASQSYIAAHSYRAPGACKAFVRHDRPCVAHAWCIPMWLREGQYLTSSLCIVQRSAGSATRPLQEPATWSAQRLLSVPPPSPAQLPTLPQLPPQPPGRTPMRRLPPRWLFNTPRSLLPSLSSSHRQHAQPELTANYALLRSCLQGSSPVGTAWC